MVVSISPRQHEASHPMDPGDVDPRLAVARMAFVVLGQPPVTPEPAEGPFDDPPQRLDLEGGRPGLARNDLQHPRAVGRDPAGEGPVHGVGPDLGQSRQLAGAALDHHGGRIEVLNVGRQDDQAPDQAEGVNEEMPLATADFFFPRRNPWGRPLRSS